MASLLHFVLLLVVYAVVVESYSYVKWEFKWDGTPEHSDPNTEFLRVLSNVEANPNNLQWAVLVIDKIIEVKEGGVSLEKLPQNQPHYGPTDSRNSEKFITPESKPEWDYYYIYADPYFKGIREQIHSEEKIATLLSKSQGDLAVKKESITDIHLYSFNTPCHNKCGSRQLPDIGNIFGDNTKLHLGASTQFYFNDDASQWASNARLTGALGDGKRKWNIYFLNPTFQQKLVSELVNTPFCEGCELTKEREKNEDGFFRYYPANSARERALHYIIDAVLWKFYRQSRENINYRTDDTATDFDNRKVDRADHVQCFRIFVSTYYPDKISWSKWLREMIQNDPEAKIQSDLGALENAYILIQKSLTVGLH